ncbi:hypothetical protein H0H92_004649 [Tricholoma furcatifolium]|nr:hypothetical protein H0H92_004649 [Tricholoma furcatifolium]
MSTLSQEKTEPSCTYDPVEGLTLAPEIDPLEKIKQLEEQISHLKSRLFEREITSGSTSPPRAPGILYADAVSLPSSSSQISGGISLPASLPVTNPTASPPFHIRSETRTPEILNNTADGCPASSPDPYIDLLFLGWNPDLPDPATLNH